MSRMIRIRTSAVSLVAGFGVLMIPFPGGSALAGDGTAIGYGKNAVLATDGTAIGLGKDIVLAGDGTAIGYGKDIALA